MIVTKKKLINRKKIFFLFLLFSFHVYPQQKIKEIIVYNIDDYYNKMVIIGKKTKNEKKFRNLKRYKEIADVKIYLQGMADSIFVCLPNRIVTIRVEDKILLKEKELTNDIIKFIVFYNKNKYIFRLTKKDMLFKSIVIDSFFLDGTINNEMYSTIIVSQYSIDYDDFIKMHLRY